MKKYSTQAFIVVFLLIISLSYVSSNVYLGNLSHNIKETYFPGEQISGWINISLENESTLSYFSDNFGNQIVLDSLLKKLNVSYICNIKDCGSNYITAGPGFDFKKLAFSSETLVGFKLTGSSVSVSDISLNIKSNAQAGCLSQLLVDFNADNTPDFSNKNYLLENCGSFIRSSCYSRFSEWFSITSTPYCEVIKIPKSPAIEIKASIKKESIVTPFKPGLIKASVYNNLGNLIGVCNLSEPSSSINYASCLFPYAIKDNTPYSVCVSSTEEQEVKGYFIQSRASAPFCGYYDIPSELGSNTFNGEYNITVVSKKFDKVNTFNINQSTFGIQNGGESLAEKINAYLEKVYLSDCSNSCVVPIKISGLSQEIELSGLNVVYTSESSGGVLTKTLYNVGKSENTIKSNYFNIPLDSLKFRTPQNQSDYILKLSLGGKEILNKSITVKVEPDIRVSSIYPSVVPATQKSDFFAFLDYSLDPLDYTFKWNFGDNTEVITTTEPLLSHTYYDVGNFTLNITMFKDNQEVSVSSFNILITSPKEAIPSRIIEVNSALSNIKTQISLLPQAYQDKIKEKIALSELEEDFKEISNNYNQIKSLTTTSDSEYASIMNQINELNIPQSVQSADSFSQSLLNYPPEIIDLSVIETLFEEEFDSDNIESYKEKIYSWSIENIDVFLNYKNLVSYKKNVREDLGSLYKITITPINEIDYPFYIIIKEPKDNIIFTKEYNISEDYDYTGIVLQNLLEPVNIEFLVLEKISPNQMPIFISPSASYLIEEKINPISIEKPRVFLKLLISFIILIIIFLGAYIFLQEWYKKSYEKSLFKNSNQLYNLIFFINNAKKQNKSDSEIISMLKAKKWKGEQIGYAIKKFKGERVGMWEIPLFKFKDNKKVQSEIDKRQVKKVAY
ncbi:MAG TPA: PKD domain-containing protein [Candidatus Paceibacterota bacterium]|nr:PKD domain-containing protein [Candidatus Paceibacterota bacterium]